MKKVVVLLAVAALLAAPAFAGIRNSKHDLSATASHGGSVVSDATSELCVFCHTPHGGQTGGFAPLWNRSLGSLVFEATDLYNSVTLEAGSAPTTVLAAVNQSDAKLCLSCHNGDSLAGGLLNPPADGQPTFDSSARNDVSGFADLFDETGSKNGSLKNDHPIGMDYSAVRVDDGELKTETAEAGSVPEHVAVGSDKLVLYGSTGVMWCSTCHDVHNPDKGTPFLNTSNAGSAMCLACHNK